MRVPLAVGLKTTLAEQLAEAARLVPHVLLVTAKSPVLVPPMATLLIVIEKLVPLFRVAVWAELVEPTAVAGNPIAVGDTVTLPPDVLPVPESATVWGLLLAVSEIVRVAARDPLTLGLNAMETPQLADAARLDPHALLAITKSPGLAPAMDTLFRVIEEVVPLVSVALCAELVEPTLIVPNEREVGLIVTDPPEPPGANPDSATVCGEFVAESVKLSVAERVPLVVGAKAMFAVQLAPAAKLVVQVFE